MIEPNMSDTLIACYGRLGYLLPYMRGEYAPHFPMPAIQYEARFMPYKVWGANQTKPCLAIFKPQGLGYICERYWF